MPLSSNPRLTIDRIAYSMSAEGSRDWSIAEILGTSCSYQASRGVQRVGRDTGRVTEYRVGERGEEGRLAIREIEYDSLGFITGAAWRRVVRVEFNPAWASDEVWGAVRSLDLRFVFGRFKRVDIAVDYPGLGLDEVIVDVPRLSMTLFDREGFSFGIRSGAARSVVVYDHAARHGGDPCTRVEFRCRDLADVLTPDRLGLLVPSDSQAKSALWMASGDFDWSGAYAAGLQAWSRAMVKSRGTAETTKSGSGYWSKRFRSQAVEILPRPSTVWLTDFRGAFADLWPKLVVPRRARKRAERSRSPVHDDIPF